MQGGGMQLSLLTFTLSCCTLISAQLYYNQQVPAQPLLGFAFGHRQHQHQHQAALAPAAPLQSGATDYAHPSVVRNAEREAQLPPELQKSARFYNNPAIAAALAKESWPTAKEAIVVDREAEKIPREMVLKIFKNAGWARRR